jgi:hypothetical protein
MSDWKNRQWFFGEIEAMKRVLAVCETWGYGNVMQVIANAWGDKDPSGALTVGPCRGVRQKQRGTKVRRLGQARERRDAE